MLRGSKKKKINKLLPIKCEQKKQIKEKVKIALK